MKCLSRVWVAIALVLGAASAQAGPLAYTLNHFGIRSTSLYIVDMAGGGNTRVGPTDVPYFLGSLALSPAGVLFGIDETGGLWKISRTTGAGTYIGSTGLCCAGLDFNGNMLLAHDSFLNPLTIYSINTSTGAASPVVTVALPTPTDVVRAMAVEDANTVLLTFASLGTLGGTALYALNLTTGAMKSIGSLPGIGPMDFLADGQLYGIGSNNSVWRIDPTTAAVTLVGNTGRGDWIDMTSTVPEPSLLVLLGIGIVAIGWRHKQRNSGRHACVATLVR